MPLGDLSFWQGAGSGAVAALTTLAGPVLHRRSGRLARLEREVQACKKRDAEFIVVKAGFRLLVGIVSREMPHSPELRICRDLLDTRLPLTEAEGDPSLLNELLVDFEPVGAGGTRSTTA